MIMSASYESIKKFMKKLDMKVFMVPEIYEKGKIRISLKVRRGNQLEYFSVDWFHMDDDGKLEWYDSDLEVGVEDGIFNYFASKSDVDDFFIEMSLSFAEKYLADKIG